MKNFVCVMAALLFPVALLGHDTWLVPAAFRTPRGAPVQVKLATSEAFPSSDSAVVPERIARFTVRTGSGTQRVEGYRVEEKFLVAEVTAAEEGHAVVVAETLPRAFVLEPKVFNQYLREEELKRIMVARAEKGQANAPGRERYRKIAKTILCVGEVQDKNYSQAEGLWLEIVPLQSPCDLRVGQGLSVEVKFEGRPLPGVPVAAGYPGVTGHHYPIWERTNAQGRVRIPLDRPGTWFVRTLHMVPAKDDAEADWHSAFSTLTFEVTQ